MRILPRGRTLLPTLALPLALLLAAPGPVSADTATPADTTTTSPDEPEARHRSVPLETTSTGASARSLPGTQGTDDADASAAPTSTATVALEEGVHVVGLRWEGEQPRAAELRVREPGGAWGAWAPLDDTVPTEPAALQATAGPDDTEDATGASGAPVDDSDQVARATTGDVVVGAVDVQVRLVGQADSPTLETWTTYQTASDVEAVTSVPVSRNEVVIGTRADWGADESAPRYTTPWDLVNGHPKLGVTIHHTAGINNYSAADVPGIIRGIFYYHGQTLGWDDIGYATLVDKYGRVWEGRAGGVEKNIQLAHAFGMNRDWTGIAVLGNHEDASVPTAELTALSELTAWTLSTHGVQAGTTVRYTNASEGWTRTLPVVHGHRDVGLTLCPGGNLYALMDTLRSRVLTDQGESDDAVQRIGGANRYESAAALARATFPEGTRTAYLASGSGLIDALGVGPVAHSRGAAVLLTQPTGVPATTLSMLRTLGVRDVVLVGGPVVIEPAVADQLTSNGFRVSRVEGANRYETAATLATQAPRTGGTVYVANGQVPADGLGAAAAAAETDGAVLLTRRGSLPPATADALRSLSPARIVVLGGDAVVSERTRQQIVGLGTGATVDRVGGANRYETSALLATDAFDGARSAVVAAGFASADAMVGTQLAARHGSPVVLTTRKCRPQAVDAAFDDLGVKLSRLAGGTSVLMWSAGYRVCS